ncbi:hypothetical protein [Olivibacter ginsenosidimutans]|uniref:hypothetical protein n=1 Tax=Olivibacter ginsenosidimutans TaxID=1176537 RepID=UPI0031F0C003
MMFTDVKNAVKPFDGISDTLKYFGVEHSQAFYVSSGQKLHQYPHQPFRTDYYSFCICTNGRINNQIQRSSG